MNKQYCIRNKEGKYVTIAMCGDVDLTEFVAWARTFDNEAQAKCAREIVKTIPCYKDEELRIEEYKD